MASGVVRSAITSALDDPDFAIDSAKAKSTKEFASSLLAAVVQNDSSMEVIFC